MSVMAEQMRRALALKDALLAVYEPEAIILFGSLGRGDGDEFSDVDLLVVMQTDRDAKSVSEEMSRYLDSLARDKHVIVRTPAAFCRQKDIPGTLAFSAAREGQALYEKPGWQLCQESTDSYETRKQEVLRQDYLGEAQDFLARAEESLLRGNLFRCRDFAKFAAARALKGLFVRQDTQPPRETDLLRLLEKARPLAPDLEDSAAFLQDLNEYCPDGEGTGETRRARGMLDSAVAFVNGITGWYATKGVEVP